MKFLGTAVKKFKTITPIIFIFSAFLIFGSCETKKKLVVCDDFLKCPNLQRRLIDFGASWSPSSDSVSYVHCDFDTAPESCGIYVMDIAIRHKAFILYAAVAYDSRWSPKGDWIVFNYQAQIYKIKINGDSLTQLTFSGTNFFPNWSPDGNRIVYDRTDPIESLGVWIMNADGSDKRMITLGREPNWSPDGSKIIYRRSQQLFVADTNGSNVLQLTFLTGGLDPSYPSFSPKGNLIAFQFQLAGEKPNIFVVNNRGSNLQRLTSDGGEEPTWSPDGSRILYTNTRYNNGYLWTMNPDGSHKIQITFPKF